MAFDWHSEPLTTGTPLRKNFRVTQNVRRFFIEHCGEQFTLNREFRAWIRSGAPLTLGEVVTEWNQRFGKR